MPRFLFVTLALTLDGCAGADPLVGTWRNTLNVVGQDLVSDEVFAADHTLTTSTTYTYAANASMNGGCTEIHRSAGAHWADTTSGTTMTLTITPAATPMNTVERSGCVHPPDNMAPTPQSDMTMGMTASDTYTYTLTNNNNTLTWTPVSTGMPADSTTFTRVMGL